MTPYCFSNSQQIFNNLLSKWLPFNIIMSKLSLFLDNFFQICLKIRILRGKLANICLIDTLWPSFVSCHWMTPFSEKNLSPKDPKTPNFKSLLSTPSLPKLYPPFPGYITSKWIFKTAVSYLLLQYLIDCTERYQTMISRNWPSHSVS